MLSQRRRYQGIVAVAILILVMLGGLVPDPYVIPSSRSQPKPASTDMLAQLGSLFEGIRDYFDSTAAYAASAPFLRGILEYELGTSSSSVVYFGRNSHLFYAGESTPAQSAGAIYRRSETLHFVDMATILRRELGRRGGKLVVAIPPNTQSIDVNDLPSWSEPHPPFEYDLAIGELRKRNIETVDLKTLLLAMEDRNSLYRMTDTHWSMRGAVLAFNLVVSGAGHSEWNVVPEAVLSPIAPVYGGDLAQLMGIERYLSDADASMLPTPGSEWKKLDIMRLPPYDGRFYAYAYERNGAERGERVLVLGDSFTQGFWLPLLQRTNAKRIGWIHHGVCGFDFADVERFEPTLVILAPTERLVPCGLKAWPPGLPRE